MKKNNTIEHIKRGLSLVAGIGISAIVGGAVRHVCPTVDMGKIMKVCVPVGAMALGGIAADAGSRYVENTVDEVVRAAQSLTSEIPEEEVTEEEVVEA